MLQNENNKLKEHVKSSIASVEVRYEKIRNVANNTTTFIADNNKLKADKVIFIFETFDFILLFINYLTEGVTASSMASDTVDLIADFNSLISSALIAFKKIRNVANNTTTFIADNNKLKADKLMDEVSQLSANIEELEQYRRRTSLQFHNVPMGCFSNFF
jgi:hypothetical protein